MLTLNVGIWFSPVENLFSVMRADMRKVLLQSFRGSQLAHGLDEFTCFAGGFQPTSLWGNVNGSVTASSLT